MPCMPTNAQCLPQASQGSLWTSQLLSDRTGVPLRTVLHWGANGVLRPTPETAGKGQGRHRLYPEHEAEICAILAPLCRFGLLVGPLRETADMLRALCARTPGSSQQHADAIARARAGKSVWLLLAYQNADLRISFVEDEDGGFRIPGPPLAQAEAVGWRPRNGDVTTLPFRRAAPVVSSREAFLLTNLAQSLQHLHRG